MIESPEEACCLVEKTSEEDNQRMQQIKMHFMHEALAMGKVAVEKGEIPVGCVIVESCHSRGTNTIIARGSNQTNESRNGTRHAEIVAVESLFSSVNSESDMTTQPPISRDVNSQPPISRVKRDQSKGILSNCDLYVTCEPCIMCAAALSKLGIRKVYFGCHNDRFGGNGSILSVHSDAYNGNNKTNNINDNKCKNVDHINSINITENQNNINFENGEKEGVPEMARHSYHRYEVEAGLLKDEAIELFQNFYTSENRRAPEAKRRKKVEKNQNNL
mmetsp:Transcript_989/g.1088  ORF Transcript_989/g.1088 Transcript_989/m.1088 type:complete len:275 (+) Transcript_989:165-989(+)